MRFKLTYDGPLMSNQRDPIGTQYDRLAEHKQSIRKVFHRQLKNFWHMDKHLSRSMTKEHPMIDNPNCPDQSSAYVGDKFIPLSEAVARQYEQFGYRFVPLVRENLSLLCSLDILLLRKDHRAGVISAGDLDNRIKTLIDTLRRPNNATELRGNESPSEGEEPFYCLLEDDRLVTELLVRSDNLLDPLEGESDHRHVKAVISVEIRPYNVSMVNLNFA